MKKIALKLDELQNHEILSNEQMNQLSGGTQLGVCFAGFSCGVFGTCVADYSTWPELCACVGSVIGSGYSDCTPW